MQAPVAPRQQTVTGTICDRRSRVSAPDPLVDPILFMAPPYVHGTFLNGVSSLAKARLTLASKVAASIQ
jgi:hypothetical protein